MVVYPLYQVGRYASDHHDPLIVIGVVSTK